MNFFLWTATFLLGLSVIAAPSKQAIAVTCGFITLVIGIVVFLRNRSKARAFLASLDWVRIVGSDTTVAIGRFKGKTRAEQYLFEGAVCLESMPPEFVATYGSRPEIFSSGESRFLPLRFFTNLSEDTALTKLDDSDVIAKLKSLSAPFLAGEVSSESVIIADNPEAVAQFNSVWIPQ